jgi:electron transfer flavoprotein alpha/beta subunit
MKIVVFLKQVPDNTKLKFNDQGPVMEGVTWMMNPYDEYALETALRLKEKAGGEATVTLLSLGDGSAKEIVKKGISYGADAAFLLNDPAFSGNDSQANAYALSQGVKQLLPDAQVLVFGQQSLDDVCGQTGPMVAEYLGLPSLTFCKNADLNGGTLTAIRETERGVETHEAQLPAVLCVMKCDYELRSSNIKGVMKANKTEIPFKSAADLGLDVNKLGKAGASTQTTKTWKRPDKTAGKVIDGADPQAAVDQVLTYLKEAKVL